MLGSAKPRHVYEPIPVSLEDLVPHDHFYRHLEAKLDLIFVRDWTRKLYAERGRPSVDPVVLFNLQLAMFFEGIRSERQLIETASLNLAHRWYLGYALDEELPDHSSLTRIWQHLGMYRWHVMDPIRFAEKLRVTIQALGWRAPLEGQKRYLPLQDDIASTALWYQSEPHAPFPVLPDLNGLEVV